MSALYYTPWLFGASHITLGLYLLAFIWFFGVWFAVILYAVKAYKYRKTDPNVKNRYLLGLTITVLSYVVVWGGIFNGYMISV